MLMLAYHMLSPALSQLKKPWANGVSTDATRGRTIHNTATIWANKLDNAPKKETGGDRRETSYGGTQLHQSFTKILFKAFGSQQETELYVPAAVKSTIPMMNTKPDRDCGPFVFVVTLIQYATVAGHFPGVSASSVKPKTQEGRDKVEVTSDEPSKGDTQVNAGQILPHPDRSQ